MLSTIERILASNRGGHEFPSGYIERWVVVEAVLPRVHKQKQTIRLFQAIQSKMGMY